METKLTEAQSLSLISEMIEQARYNFQKGAGTVFIFNGIAVALTAILNIVLLFALPDPQQSFWVWMLMIPSSAASRLINNKVWKQAVVITHIDRIIYAVWNGFLISVVLFLALIFGYAAASADYRLCILITPGILVMSGAAEYITAKACRYKPLLAGACVMWAGAMACLASYVFAHAWSGIIQFVILAICLTLGLTIPGYKMNQMAKRHV